MPRLKCVDVGLPYKKIMQGSKWVGRVYKNAQGTYTGQIGQAPNRIEATAPTDRQAFEEVAARFFGQPSAAALHAHNAQVRSANRQARRQRGDILSQLERVLGLRPGSARTATVGTPSGERAVRLTGEAAAEAEARRIEMGEDDFMPPREQRRAILGNDHMPGARRRRTN